MWAKFVSKFVFVTCLARVRPFIQFSAYIFFFGDCRKVYLAYLAFLFHFFHWNSRFSFHIQFHIFLPPSPCLTVNSLKTHKSKIEFVMYSDHILFIEFSLCSTYYVAENIFWIFFSDLSLFRHFFRDLNHY